MFSVIGNQLDWWSRLPDCVPVPHSGIVDSDIIMASLEGIRNGMPILTYRKS